ncbi:type VI secretion system tip protein VgrG [Burkholderia sp. Bp8992]|uniref:type VI secretion system Vgr family protein n=1 Tax=Burkholderia sp. Bp8992 TaxID=2184554 RepID=UPI000F58187B|nr:type VI secretion system Vgr family protein [Burkholderia sp. Bp8992]RQS37406.1 type VI secretion system tip protein VgrG [Burkholderia sp. Bp8992]
MSINTGALSSLLRGWSQHSRFLWMRTSFGTDALIAESLHGWEAVGGGGFRFELTALSENARLAIGKLIGGPILIEWQAAEGSETRRPVHGHVVAAELVGSNGGLARYRFTIEPWFALLRQRVDSYNYQHASVLDITEQVFGYYTHGAIAPAWRWSLADQSKYRKRSLTAQAGESDFDFLQRLWAEEGIFYWFEHKGDANAANFGEHTLVLADSNQQFKPDDPVVIGFHQASDGNPAGNIQDFMAARRWRIGQVTRASWDYRTLSTRPSEARATGAVMPGIDRDVAGPYAYQTAAVGDYRAQQQLDAQRVSTSRSEGRGTRRDMRPGLRFAMRDHPVLKASQAFVCLRVEHDVQANVDADVHGAIERKLGKPSSAGIDASDVVEGLTPDDLSGTGTHPGNAVSRNDTGRVYGNAFVALPVEQSYRSHEDGVDGARSHPETVMQGAQTAIVVGADAPVHTDRDHRVRIQHHAQRGQNSASREDHPRDSNAPADQGAGTWTRMMTPIGGDNWGGVAVPRVGQEVWVDWLEGQPDRPVAVASLYNGRGNDNGQHNARAGGPSGSTGNAAAWFAGNGHAATLTGFKTQELSQSQQGTGGYRHFMMDDTAGQSSVHLYTTDSRSGLMLGHLKSMNDNVRQADRGYGAELNTEASGAVRGGAGVLVSAAAGVNQMDASSAAQVLGDSHDLLDGLAEAARAQGAEPGASQSSASQADASSSGRTDAGASSSTLAAVTGLSDGKQAISAARAGSSSSQATGGGDGSATAWSRPHLVAYGQDGVVAVSARSHVWLSGTETVLAAGQDLQWTAQNKTGVVANQGILLYTDGKKGDGRPVAVSGIALHAACGSVGLQAQRGGNLGAVAQQAVSVASATASVTAQASRKVLLTAAKAYLKMEGGGIEIGVPGTVKFHAANHVLTGPRSSDMSPQIAQSQVKACPTKDGDAAGRGAATL